MLSETHENKEEVLKIEEKLQKLDVAQRTADDNSVKNEEDYNTK